MISLIERFGTDGVPLGDFDDLYLSFDEAPVDTPVLADGDNSVLAQSPWGNPGVTETPADEAVFKTLAKASVARTAQSAAKRSVIVPHPRDLRYKPTYMRGSDVTALDRALWRSGTYKHKPGTPFRRAFGPGMRDHVRKFQAAHKLKADGVYGLDTHKVIAKWYDPRAIALVQQAVPKPAPSKADQIVAAAMIGYNYRHLIHYTQGPARMWLIRNKIRATNIPRQSQIWEDCSSWATYLYWQAGLPDPNGLAYNGQGYTGTLSNHGQRIWTDGAPVGALHFYGGSYPFHHVSIRISKSGRVVSHGSEYGPYLLDVRYRGDLRQTRKYF